MKKLSKKFLLLLTSLLLVSAFLLFWFWWPSKTCQKLFCLKMSNLEKFHLVESYEDNKDNYRALWSNGENFLRIEANYQMKNQEARQKTEAKAMKMKALFENALSPYPGMISDEVVCGEEFKPQFKEELIGDLGVASFRGYLNSRLVFGACTQDQAVYQGILAIFYCPQQKTLYTLELITPNKPGNEDFLETLFTLSCR